MNTPLRAGIVGVGRLGRHHVRVLAEMPGVTLAGVYDKNPERGREHARPHGADQADSLDALMAACDIISVVTSTSAHYEVAHQIIEAGVACFIEKPICATSAEAEQLIALAVKKGVPLGVGHIERYNPAFVEFLADPVEPRFIEAHRLAEFTARGTDVAVVYDLMIHDIDLLLCLMGEEPTDVRAAGAAVVSDDLDICNARLEFARGAVANLTASRISGFGMRRFRIFGEANYVALDLLDKKIERHRLFASEAELRTTGFEGLHLPLGDRGQVVAVQRHTPDAPDMLHAELADFIQSMRDGRTPPVTGQDGLRALRVAERIHSEAHALLKSARLG
jgi:predicted dehydrogenase